MVQRDSTGEARREFLKKAGTAAWVVPAIQIVNMVPANAQTAGSMVTTVPPPSTTIETSTTTTTTTTTKPPDGCTEFSWRAKWVWTGNRWDRRDGDDIAPDDCIQIPGESCPGAGFTTAMLGDNQKVRIIVGDDCEVVMAAYKAGGACIPIAVPLEDNTLILTANPEPLTQIEFLCRGDLSAPQP